VTFVGLCVDGTAVVYNKFDASPSSSPDHHPPHPASDRNCVIDTVGHWTAARCAEQHLAVCQSDHSIVPGKSQWLLVLGLGLAGQLLINITAW